MSARKTRQEDVWSLFGESPDIDQLEIKGSCLPSYKQVLFCFLANIKNIQIRLNQKAISAKSTAMKRVISEIQKHYKKAAIDLKSVKSLKYDINKLYTNYRIMTSIVY